MGPGPATDAALHTATKLATGLIVVCSRITPEGMIFPIDPNLRPEGATARWSALWPAISPTTSAGPRPWEFQALLKAPPSGR